MVKANGKVPSSLNAHGGISSGRHVTDLNASETAPNKSIDKSSTSNSVGKRKEGKDEIRESGSNDVNYEHTPQQRTNNQSLFARAPNPSSGTRQPSPVS